MCCDPAGLVKSPKTPETPKYEKITKKNTKPPTQGGAPKIRKKYRKNTQKWPKFWANFVFFRYFFFVFLGPHLGWGVLFFFRNFFVLWGFRGFWALYQARGIATHKCLRCSLISESVKCRFGNPRRVPPCAVKTCAVRPVFAPVVGELRAANPSKCPSAHEPCQPIPPEFRGWQFHPQNLGGGSFTPKI